MKETALTAPDEEEEEEPGFFRRYRVALGVLLAVGAAVIPLMAKVLHGITPAPHREEVISMVKLLPLPPPPPPPPPEQQQTIRQPDMIEQTPVNDPPPKAPDEKPDPPKAHDEPPPGPLGTNIKGDGAPDGFNLGGSGGGGLMGGGGGGGGGRWGWYAGQVQAKIAEALRKDARTRDAAIHVNVRIWPDLTGRVTRAQLVGSTGNASIDAALRDEILTGLQLQEPPPTGMPAPIVLRLTALRPN